MCLHKITIKNPYFKMGRFKHGRFFNTKDSYIQVPCGQCQQCVAMRQGFFLQRVQMESLRSHLYYFTLTYNRESLKYVHEGEYHLPYPYLPDIQLLFQRLRNAGHKFRFTYVTEYGKDRHRPHFHGILAVDKSEGHWLDVERKFYKLLFHEWRRNVATTVNKKGDIIPNTRCPDWRPLFTPIYDYRGRCKTFDFHYIEPIKNHDNDVSYYVSKYITKYDPWIRKLLQKIALDPNIENPSKLISILRPRCNSSKDFGDWKDSQIKAYIDKCASRDTLFRWPQYFDIYTGKQMPMSPYYGQHTSYASVYHAMKRLEASIYDDSTNFDNNMTLLDIQILIDSVDRYDDDFFSIQNYIYNRLNDDFLDSD